MSHDNSIGQDIMTLYCDNMSVIIISKNPVKYLGPNILILDWTSFMSLFKHHAIALEYISRKLNLLIFSPNLLTPKDLFILGEQ